MLIRIVEVLGVVIQGVPEHSYQAFFSVDLGRTKSGTVELNRKLIPMNPNLMVPKPLRGLIVEIDRQSYRQRRQKGYGGILLVQASGCNRQIR